ncbi:hypothetical protein [Promicromonospora aerolata]|uniref:RDD family protein n=1 Tax=Promicromonospora aerolata TaxID=195749 RepID=A0ABW4V2U9_9MICO
MTTSTLDQTETADTTATKPVSKKRDSRLRAVWQHLAPTKSRDGGLPLVLWAGFYRTVVLAGDYLLAFISAMVVIPSLGAWLHAQSGASQGGLTEAGTVAMWLMPFLFLVALLVAGEIALMRGMWRWATRMIARIRDSRTKETETETESETTVPRARTGRQSKRNHRRST